MTRPRVSLTSRQLRTPRSAAVAGILFAVLLGAADILIRTSGWGSLDASEESLKSANRTLSIGLALVPFAGIAFLWFIGVLRDRIGVLEDRFFSTVFFGSGLLFLAMTFVGSSVAGATHATLLDNPTSIVNLGVYRLGRETTFRLVNIYAIRMAAVFMISLGTIWFRTQSMPRVLAILTCSLALVLLVSISFSLWVVLIFPGWVLIISAYILSGNLRIHGPVIADKS